MDQISCVYVGHIVLGEAVQETGKTICAKGEDGAEATGFSFAWACNSLLDETATEIGIDETQRRLCDCGAERLIAHTILFGEALEQFCLEDLHRFVLTIALSVMDGKFYLMMPRWLLAMKSRR